MSNPPKPSYEDIYKQSIEQPEEFWAQIAKSVSWSKPWKRVLNNDNPPFTKWFEGGELNACHNAVDRHVDAGHGAKPAIIYDSPLLKTSQTITYLQLQHQVSRFAGALSRLGVTKGDRIVIYMPAIPQTTIAMLASARLGAVHCVVFGGFAASELANRIQHCTPKVIIAANCAIEPAKIVQYMDNLTEAMDLATHKPSKAIVYQRRNIAVSKLPDSRFVDWDAVLEGAEPHGCVPVEANEPLYILYTSGTTGDPKGVQRPIGGHLATLAWTMQVVYGVGTTDVWWAISDLGWVVGHSYMLYAPLLAGTTQVLYEGKPTTTPDPGQYYRVISEYRVNAIFIVPTALRILKKEDPEGYYRDMYDITSLRNIFVGGEHCDLSTKIWAEDIFKAPIINHWWQTETGHAITTICLGLDGANPVVPKLSTGKPFMGYQIKVLRDDGTIAGTNELGRIVVKLPMPPGTFSTLYRADSKFVEYYFTRYPGYYDTMDAGYVDDRGFVYVTARDDDVINVAGHRISTLSLENVVLSHPAVIDACVVSVPDEIKSEVPFCFYVMKDQNLEDKVVSKELVDLVREVVGPVVAFRLAAAVKALPQTRSGKICRKSISIMARDTNFKVPSSVVDGSVYKDIGVALKRFGFCQENQCINR